MTDATPFDRFAESLDGPMLIVTAAAADGPAGCLVGFATQTSIDPPRFLVCLSRPNRTARVAEHAEHLCVHLVPRSNRRLAERFGGVTGDEADKFAGVAWTAGPYGLPVLEECPRWFAGRILGRFDLGDHVGYLLDPQVGSIRPAGPPLMLQQTDSIEPGHPA